MRTLCMTRHFRGVLGPIIAGVVAATLSGCGSSIKTSPTVLEATVDGLEGQEATTVTKGQTLTVRLPTTGGAPYSWRLTPESADNSLVSLDQRIDQQYPTGGVAGSGEPAWDVFIFRAEHTGQVTLNFMYEHQFTADMTPARQFALDIDVTKPQRDSAVASAE